MRASLTALLTTLPTLICLAAEHPHLTPPDLEALIECRQRAIDYAQLVPSLKTHPKPPHWVGTPYRQPTPS